MDSEMNDQNEAEAATPEIRVSTVFCIPLEMCKLSDPPGGNLRVSSPFKVNIVNGIECNGDSKTVTWKIGTASDTLAQGATHTHTMVNDTETLELYYDECWWLENRPHDGPGPKTPRVTINLTRIREK